MYVEMHIDIYVLPTRLLSALSHSLFDYVFSVYLLLGNDDDDDDRGTTYNNNNIAATRYRISNFIGKLV